MNKKFTLLTLVAISVLVLSGCGQKMTERQIEKNLEKQMGDGYNVDMDNDTVTVETEDGGKMTAGEDVELPKDFPSDVYVIDGDLIGVAENIGQKGYQVTLRTDKTNDEILEIYRDKFADDNWVEDSSMNMGGMIMLIAKKDGRTLTVASVPDDEDEDQTVLSITIVED
jgi:ABC-type enterochelin transport system substrate-binding protein